MATDLHEAKPTPNVRPVPSAKYEGFVGEQLRRARQRIRTLDVSSALLGLLSITLAYGLLMALLDRALELSPLSRQLAFACYAVVVLAALALGLIRPFLRPINPYFAASQIEHTLPEAKNSVINWLDLHEQALPQAIRMAVSHRAARDLGRTDLEQAISARRTAWLGGIAGGFLLGLVILFVVGPRQFPSLLSLAFAPFVEAPIATRTRILVTRPEGGNVTIPVGRALSVAIWVEGRIPDPQKPDALRLQFRYNPADPYEERFLERGESTREWAITVPAGQVHNGFWYKVAGGDAETPEYRVQVRSTPLLTGFDVTYHHRPYLGWKDEVTHDPNLQALRGTEVILLARTNREVQSGQLLIANEKPIAGGLVPEDPTALRFRLILEKDGAYRIWFTSRESEKNSDPMPYSIRVLQDRAPQVALTKPAEQIALPANGMLQAEGTASDDFGITAMRLRLREETTETMLQPKPYREGKPLRAGDGSYPTSLAYKDFVRLDHLKQENGQAFPLEPGMRLEYWLEAIDNCDYPEPNLGSSKHQRIDIAPPDKDQAKKDQQQAEAQKDQQKHEQEQDQQLQKQSKPENQAKQDQGNEGGEKKDGQQSKPNPGQEGGEDNKLNQQLNEIQKAIDQQDKQNGEPKNNHPQQSKSGEADASKSEQQPQDKGNPQQDQAKPNQRQEQNQGSQSQSNQGEGSPNGQPQQKQNAGDPKDQRQEKAPKDSGQQQNQGDQRSGQESGKQNKPSEQKAGEQDKKPGEQQKNQGADQKPANDKTGGQQNSENKSETGQKPNDRDKQGQNDSRSKANPADQKTERQPGQEKGPQGAKPQADPSKQGEKKESGESRSGVPQEKPEQKAGQGDTKDATKPDPSSQKNAQGKSKPEPGQEKANGEKSPKPESNADKGQGAAERKQDQDSGKKASGSEGANAEKQGEKPEKQSQQGFKGGQKSEPGQQAEKSEPKQGQRQDQGSGRPDNKQKEQDKAGGKEKSSSSAKDDGQAKGRERPTQETKDAVKSNDKPAPDAPAKETAKKNDGQKPDRDTAQNAKKQNDPANPDLDALKKALESSSEQERKEAIEKLQEVLKNSKGPGKVNEAREALKQAEQGQRGSSGQGEGRRQDSPEQNTANKPNATDKPDQPQKPSSKNRENSPERPGEHGKKSDANPAKDSKDGSQGNTGSAGDRSSAEQGKGKPDQQGPSPQARGTNGPGAQGGSEENARDPKRSDSQQPDGNEPAPENPPEEGTPADPRNRTKAADLQLEEIKKRVQKDKDILKKANMTEDEYQRFVKAYEELLKQQQAPGADKDNLAGPQRGNGNLPNQGVRRVQPGVQDKQTNLQRSGPAQAPPEFRESYKEFTRRLAEMEQKREKK